MADSHKNFASSLVVTAPAPASSGTSLVVTAGQGALFPTPPFNATVWPISSQPSAANAEIVRVTNIATDTLTITRQQEGTSARTIGVGDQIAATVTAKTLTDVETAGYAAGGTDVAVADGGTGSSTASGARTNLGLAIGTDVEAHDADLTTIAGLTPTDDDVLQRKAGAWTNRTIAQLATDLAIAGSYQPLDSDLTAIAALATTSFGRGLLILADAAATRTALGLGTASTSASTDFQPIDSDLTSIAALTTTSFGRAFLALADAAATRTALSLVIGTDVQAYDAELAALAGLTSAADKLPYFTGSGTAAVTSLSSFVRTLLDDADAATARATLGVGSGAVATDTIWDTKGDLVAATGADAATKVAVGADGKFLQADSAQTAGVKWASPSSVGQVASDTIWDTKGDIAAATAADTAAKLAVGANTKVLVADSSQTTGLKWQFTKDIQIKVIDDATTLTTGDGKIIFCIPTSLGGCDLTAIAAFVTTVSSSGLPTVQIRNITQTADMLTTKVSIDASEFTSYTAATAAVIDTGNDDVATGDLIAIDVDVAGTGAKGLGVILTFTLP